VVEYKKQKLKNQSNDFRFVTSKYRADIDGLRGVAILSVLIFHTFPSLLKGGFIGVDIFFVISGFLISNIIFESLDKKKFSFANFYTRRIKRIFPALLLVLIFCLIFGWIVLLSDEYAQISKHVVGGIGFVSNFILWSEAGYFDNVANTKPLQHLWSLGIEEQFYLLWPLLCWLLFKKKNFSIILISLTTLSFFANLFFTNNDNIEAFYSPLSRMWELLFGALLAYFTSIYNIYYKKICENLTIVNFLSFVGFLFLIFGFLFINKELKFPGLIALIPVTGATMIILSGPNSIFNKIFLSNKIIVFFGLISYPLYLWHWPLLVFARIIEKETPDRFFRLAIIFVSIILSWITYQFIEKNIRRSHGYKYIKTLISLSVIVLSVSLIIFFKNGLPDRKVVINSDFTKDVQYQFAGPSWPYSKNEICLSNFPYKEQNKLAWWFCMQSKNEPPTILLLGDSFANQHYPGFATNSKLTHHSILSIGTCSIDSDGTGVNVRNPCFGDRPKNQATFINSIIKSTSSLKFVIIDGLFRIPNLSTIDKTLERIQFLEKFDLQVVIFIPHLEPGFDTKACFRSPFYQNPKDCLVPSSYRKDLVNNFNPLINAVKNKYPKVLFFDQNEIFCDRYDNNCSFIRDKLPLHRDTSHISEYASILMQDYFNNWSKINIPSIFYDDKILK
jgi:peptidoglycan/LPS O-acetylase OafA/YrhL